MTLVKKKKEKIYKPSFREQMMHQSWCFKNNIFIYFENYTWIEGCIIINDKGKITRGEKTYYQNKLKPKDEKYWDVIWNLYTEYYLMNNNIDKIIN